MGVLELQNIKKSFTGTGVLKGINLTVGQGEFITLLGASGCGKTTTLRIIAGLESPDSGKVLLDGVDITDLVPNKRNVNTVFQNYALFPHMNVAENVGYSLKIRGMAKKSIQEKVNAMLELVQLPDYGRRMPAALSGGQRQRVAIARSLVAQPQVLLLDEPLGALDLQLRRQMQTELKRLQKNLGITFIYITHDQEEALNMSDRIAVMRQGVFEQIGTPTQIYDRPKTAYVAQFVGSANIITGTATKVDDLIKVENQHGAFTVMRRNCVATLGAVVQVAVRSEQLILTRETDPEPEGGGLIGVIREKSFSGGMLRIAITMGKQELVASRHGIDSILAPGERVRVAFLPEHGVVVQQ